MADKKEMIRKTQGEKKTRNEERKKERKQPIEKEYSGNIETTTACIYL